MIPVLQRLRSRPQPARTPIGLALQGGVSWGAYTWGVLARHAADLGVRETLDIAATFTDARNDCRGGERAVLQADL